MSKNAKSRRPKSSSARRQELVEELQMLASDIESFERDNAYYWLRSVATRLRKLVVELPRTNRPLLTDLAKERNFSLVVYVFNGVIAEAKAKNLGGPYPTSSLIPNVFSLSYDPWYATPMTLEKALDVRCYIMASQEYSFRQVILDMADTEGAHSDLGRPEALDVVDKINFSGVPGSYTAIYHFAQIVSKLGYRFVQAISESGAD